MNENSSPTSFARLDRQNLVSQVASALTEAILSGQLPLGAHLSESAIARDMGLSRAPVREAARLLESTGLVVSMPNRGFFVRTITADALESLYELRLCIEQAAVRRLVHVGDKTVVKLLRHQILQMQILTRQDEIAAHINADMNFHRLICSQCGNSRFLSIFDQVANELRLTVMLIGHLYGDGMQIAQKHNPIVDAIEAQDADAASAAIAYHLGDAQTRVLALFREIEARQVT